MKNMRGLLILITSLVAFESSAQVVYSGANPYAASTASTAQLQQQQYQLQQATTAAQQSTQALKSSSNMNMMFGMVMLASCMMESKPNMLTCMVGGVMLAQSMQQQQAANQAQQTLNASQAAPAGYYAGAAPTTVAYPAGYGYPAGVGGVPVAPAVVPYGTPVTLTSSMLPASASPSAARGLAALNSAGYQVTSAGVTMPNGQYLDAKSLNATEALTSAGFDQKSIQSTQSASAKAREQVAKQLNASNEEI